MIVSVWFLLCLLSSVLVRFYEREKKQRKERGELVKKLQDALLNVKTLRGLLPICSSCQEDPRRRGLLGKGGNLREQSF